MSEFIYQLLTCLPENDHRLHKLPEPIPNSEVKLLLFSSAVGDQVGISGVVLLCLVSNHHCHFFLGWGGVGGLTSDDDRRRQLVCSHAMKSTCSMWYQAY